MESEDDDLNIAIAMSLQDQENSSSANPNKQKDFRPRSPPKENKSKQTSSATYEKQLSPTQPQPHEEAQNQRVSPTLIKPACGIPGLDRKKDEAARLERLARKRKHLEPSPQPEHSDRGKRSKSDRHDDAAQVIDLTADSPIRQQKGVNKVQSNLTENPSNRSRHSHRPAETESLPKTTNVPDKTTLEYPRGVVKRTWAFRYERKDDIKIEEVLRKADLNIAVLSSFQWDMEWIVNKLDQTRTKMIFVMQAKEEATREQYRRETAYAKHVRLCFPPMDGQVNCMHSKLMLLFYKDFLRVVVPTANLVPYDWGETGVMENTVFLIDLPRRPQDAPRLNIDENNSTLFQRELVYFLESMGMHEDVRRGLLNFDFTATKDIAFVHTIGGSHMGQKWRRTGYCGLGRAIKSLGLDTNEPLEIDFVTDESIKASSIGSLNQNFLTQIYLSAQGDDGLTEFERRNSKSKSRRRVERRPPAGAEQQLSRWVQEKFRIYFPTEETVLASRGGPGNGGTICFQPRWYNSDVFPRSLMRDCKSLREGLLMHNKILYARYEKPRVLANGLRCAAWAYLGSANLSESAWGKLIKDRVSGGPKLNCRNWECGVVLPIHLHGDTSPGATQPVGMDIFQGHLPAPMWLPGQPYGARSPWFYSEHGL
ncbi:phospholipase D/nuclease [Xylona heveae TC161]|uniref:Phospholipase D/nuclease n=1 Tax=Xylona heveae (strain CBS 132557 / TC161) TaxID=1328760 RepID=A0A165FRJ0_XYLHT|nr:phospholipase D/nuclease [Xylona heveae TC161]KZF21292.1 phospholipase D/nuclease [Xylona heveae TC161]